MTECAEIDADRPGIKISILEGITSDYRIALQAEEDNILMRVHDVVMFDYRALLPDPVDSIEINISHGEGMIPRRAYYVVSDCVEIEQQVRRPVRVLDPAPTRHPVFDVCYGVARYRDVPVRATVEHETPAGASDA